MTASWRDVETGEPEFAARVKAILTGRKHHTLATIRADGSPRVSGIELQLGDDEPHIHLGMMGGSRKAADTLRDSRIAIHALSPDPPETDQASWPGDVKLTGTAHDVPAPDDAEAGSHRFRLDLTEVVLTRLDPGLEYLVIETWRPGAGISRWERR